MKPVGKTLDNMRKHLEYDPELRTFLKDQCIEDAYQALKPKVDELHQRFINLALGSARAKSMEFSPFFEIRRQLLELKMKAKEKGVGDKDIQNLEGELDGAGETLRKAFGDIFKDAGARWKELYGAYGWKKGGKETKGSAVLSCPDVLKVIDEENEKKELPEQCVRDAIKALEGFFTYLGGFNQNRENYYETAKEAATAIATRIVHENLPRFTDNALTFESGNKEYLDAYRFLKDAGKVIQRKDEKPVTPISEAIFCQNYFGNCLTQEEIERYNEEIGNCNLVINLYNQTEDEEGFRRLPIFKVLYKQIGCGKKDALFFRLTHEKKEDADAARRENPNKQFDSVEEILERARTAGEKYFQPNKTADMDTLSEFIRYLKERKDYSGFYWSKNALNTISNKYFANWHALKDRLKETGVFKKGGKDDEEYVKIPDAIELQPFFELLDVTKDWRKTLFKLSQRNGSEEIEKMRIIDNAKTPHEALLGMLTLDVADRAEKFVNGAAGVMRVTREYFANADKMKEERRRVWKEEIKQWMDHALAVNRMLKYFKVRESKVKGAPIDATLTKALGILLYGKDGDAEWFKWYDTLRNFLTKKPQDDAKENKLKLNFENGSLLGGWSDGQEKNKAAVLLRKDGLYYLGILKKKSLFDTKQENNPMYEHFTQGCERLILTNLKFQTLAGKGFSRKFRIAYGAMGKQDPQKAIISLQDIMKERYLNKYPLLSPIASASYTDKKKFDKEVQEALKESYDCKFRKINWNEIEQYTKSGDMYLFQIHSKDFAPGASGKKDLQTIYWQSLFDSNGSHQLNGGGEIFYRKQALRDKHVKKGYEQKPWIIESRRFTLESGKFMFHCPIKLNYKSSAQSDPKYAFPFVNKYINEHFAGNADICFLGIDRGEKHLAYYSLVDSRGTIVDQGTLNIPFTDSKGNPRTVRAIKRTLDKNGHEWVEEVECSNYNDLLAARAGDRDYARKNWQTIGTIKELKEGYISQVIHKIVRLAALDSDKPMFIVLEDLSIGFMRGRQKIEKSVYKQFEVALAKKLSFLVDKSKDGKYGEVGSVTAALQLTPPIKNFDELKERGKQAGVMLFVRPDYTSQTDPVTGWRKRIYIDSGSELTIRKKVTESFEDIAFDGKDYVFVYKDVVTGKCWSMYSGKDGESLKRFHRVRSVDKDEWKSEPQNLAEMLDCLFKDFDKDRSLLSQIVDEGMQPKKVNEHSAWESFRFVIKLIQQIRNTDGGDGGRESDFLLSPVREHGNHFDSRPYWDEEQRTGHPALLPSCGDANGAYNIARKGIILHEHMKRDFKLYVRDEEWDSWLAGKETWDNWLRNHEKDLRKTPRKGG